MSLKKILEDHELFFNSIGGKGERAYLYKANLRGAELQGRNLSEANLSEADLRGASLYDADLSYADLVHTDLRYADLRKADLYMANLSGANLRGSNLFDADLRRAYLPEKTFVIMGEIYFISIANGDYLRAGDYAHSIEEWKRFSKKEIYYMGDDKLLNFHPRLLDIIKFYCD